MFATLIFSAFCQFASGRPPPPRIFVPEEPVLPALATLPRRAAEPNDNWPTDSLREATDCLLPVRVPELARPTLPVVAPDWRRRRWAALDRPTEPPSPLTAKDARDRRRTDTPPRVKPEALPRLRFERLDAVEHGDDAAWIRRR
jgi:hypothetical protein